MTSKIIVNTIEADTGISSVTFASNINLQNDSSVLVSSSGVTLGTGSTIAAPSANEITLSTNSAERLRISSNGSVGINTTADTRQLEIFNTSHATAALKSDTQSSLFFADSDTNIGQISYMHSDNYMYFRVNDAERLRIDSSGRLLLGTTTEGNASADNLTIADSGNCGITIRSGTTSFGEIYFSDATSGGGEYDGFIAYSHSSRYMVLATAQTERLRIDSSGHVLPGANNTYDLGSTAKGWRNVYMNDLNLSNMNGDTNDVDGTQGSWTIQEGKDNLYIINRLNGKKFKIKMEEIS